VRAYLEIEQRRLGGRLKVEIQIDEAALDAPIPVLSVQPLVENAIKHGLAPTSQDTSAFRVTCVERNWPFSWRTAAAAVLRKRLGLVWGCRM
jgi:LytS/YehU family sensor histidine kinase